VPVAALRPDEVEALWRIYAASYRHVDRPTFAMDLAEKELVFVGRDSATDEIVGFSTAVFYPHSYRGRVVDVYFSGDTMIRPEYWGQTALQACVLRTLVARRLRHPGRRLYWFLICSGYRTYLTMARNVPEHWPHFRRPTPGWERGLIDSLGRARFGAHWRPERGVIATGGHQVVLRSEVAPFTAEVRRIPEVEFFTRANPGYARGDELAMIGRIDLRLVLHVLAKWARRALRAPGVRSPAAGTT
jgi:hypothetical protein